MRALYGLAPLEMYQSFLTGRVVELVDTLVLGTSGAIRGGSSPLSPTLISGCDTNRVTTFLFYLL